MRELTWCGQQCFVAGFVSGEMNAVLSAKMWQRNKQLKTTQKH